MKIRFLGTGTSTGVPEIGCTCAVCKSNDKRDRRLRSSVYIEVDGSTHILIDCTPDFRCQALRIPFEKMDALLLTHEHYDHTGGIDDLRPYSRFGTVRIYAEERVKANIEARMPYCFSNNNYGGVPDIRISPIIDSTVFHVNDVAIMPIRAMHYKLPILGFKIRNFAYLTDLKTLPDSELIKLDGIDTLVVSALRKAEHISHQNIEQAIALSRKIGAKKTYFTHMSHHAGLHAEIEKEIPSNMFFAYDGLELIL